MISPHVRVCLFTVQHVESPDHGQQVLGTPTPSGRKSTECFPSVDENCVSPESGSGHPHQAIGKLSSFHGAEVGFFANHLWFIGI